MIEKRINSLLFLGAFNRLLQTMKGGIGMYSKDIWQASESLDLPTLAEMTKVLEKRAEEGNKYCSVRIEDNRVNGFRWWVVDDPGKVTRDSTSWRYKKPSDWLLEVILPELERRLEDTRTVAQNIDLVLEFVEEE